MTPLHIQSGTQLNCMETYSGPGPYSEPETRNIREFVKSIQPNVVVSQRHLFWDEDLLCLRKCFGEMLQNFTRFLDKNT